MESQVVVLSVAVVVSDRVVVAGISWFDAGAIVEDGGEVVVESQYCCCISSCSLFSDRVVVAASVFDDAA